MRRSSSSEGDSEQRKLLDDEQLMAINFLKLMYEEIDSAEKAQVIGGVTCAIASNIFAYILNSGGSDILAQRFHFSNDAASAWKYITLLNGFLTTTATNLYAAGGTFKSAIDLKRRFKITPEYEKWITKVMIAAPIIGVLGISGVVSLVYYSYKDNIGKGITFAGFYGLVNLCNAVFFVISLMNMGRKSLRKQLHVDKQKILYLQETILRMSHNIEQLSIPDFITLRTRLKGFHQERRLTEQKVQVNDLMTFLANELFRHSDSSIVEIKKENQEQNKIPVQYYIPTLYPTITSAWLFYLVGAGSIKLLTSNADGYAVIVGLCSSLITTISVAFSSIALTDKCLNIKSDSFSFSGIATSLILLGMSLIASFGYLTLADQFSDSSTTTFMEVSAVIQSFCLVMNALLETKIPSIKRLNNLRLQLFDSQLPPPELQKETFAKNLKDLSENITLGSKRDVNNLHKLFSTYDPKTSSYTQPVLSEEGFSSTRMPSTCIQ